jgi:cobyrinic acid a,c-diamide synthase
MKGLLVAGTHSGVGKTTVAVGLIRALSRRGCKVQPFKVGPDYIDPSYHEAVCGLSSRTLDGWLLEEAAIREILDRAMRGKDLALIEGMMGLYDGVGGASDEASTARLAKLLRLPVVLVVDASAASRSVGATVLGFKSFDPEVRLAGVILNGIAGERHLELVRPALAKAGVPLLGHLRKTPELSLPERHLGLVPVAEGKVAEGFFERLAIEVERTFDLERLLALAGTVPASRSAKGLFPDPPLPKRAAIAVARDRAFNFYYPESLELLEAWGAEIIPFSPLRDPALPEGASGMYLGGGFPELYARELAENRSLREAVRQAARRGLPIYAECGGLMYLGESIEDANGETHPMAGVLPCRSSMRGTRLALGYRTVRALDDNPLMRAGEPVRGHEFHLSALKGPTPCAAAYEVLEEPGRREGFRLHNVLASYVHLHFAAKKSLAPAFVDFCAAWRSGRPLRDMKATASTKPRT